MRTLFGRTAFNMPSRFLKEIPEEVREIVSSNGGNTRSIGGGYTGGARLMQARSNQASDMVAHVVKELVFRQVVEVL